MRRSVAGTPDMIPQQAAVRRPMPRSPYQGSDLLYIGVLTAVLLIGLAALKIIL